MASPQAGLTFTAEYVPDHQRMVRALLILLERHAPATPAPPPPDAPQARR
jgi:hypothetical protein